MPRSPEPIPSLEYLDSRTFTAAQIQRATGLSAAALNRLEPVYGLELFSRPAGQGRQREYCFADVCQITLAADLLGKNVPPKAAMITLNRIAGFEGYVTAETGPSGKLSAVKDEDLNYGLNPNPDNEKLRRAGWETVTNLPPLYHTEDQNEPFVICFHSLGQHEIRSARAIEGERWSPFLDGVLVNATSRIFRMTARKLVDVIRRTEG
ncbi:hypothetical protein ACX4MT_09240 [Roseomonas mucosa]